MRQEIRYDMRRFFNLLSNADMSQLNLPHRSQVTRQMMRFWDAVASAGPYASLHLAPDR